MVLLGAACSGHAVSQSGQAPQADLAVRADLRWRLDPPCKEQLHVTDEELWAEEARICAALKRATGPGEGAYACVAVDCGEDVLVSRDSGVLWTRGCNFGLSAINWGRVVEWSESRMRLQLKWAPGADWCVAGHEEVWFLVANGRRALVATEDIPLAAFEINQGHLDLLLRTQPSMKLAQRKGAESLDAAPQEAVIPEPIRELLVSGHGTIVVSDVKETSRQREGDIETVTGDIELRVQGAINLLPGSKIPLYPGPNYAVVTLTEVGAGVAKGTFVARGREYRGITAPYLYLQATIDR
ncbi:MAG: hypothetical protein U0636_09435 [Phycisphaerales bacterium]